MKFQLSRSALDKTEQHRCRKAHFVPPRATSVVNIIPYYWEGYVKTLKPLNPGSSWVQCQVFCSDVEKHHAGKQESLDKHLRCSEMVEFRVDIIIGSARSV